MKNTWGSRFHPFTHKHRRNAKVFILLYWPLPSFPSFRIPSAYISSGKLERNSHPLLGSSLRTRDRGEGKMQKSSATLGLFTSLFRFRIGRRAGRDWKRDRNEKIEPDIWKRPARSKKGEEEGGAVRWEVEKKESRDRCSLFPFSIRRK